MKTRFVEPHSVAPRRSVFLQQGISAKGPTRTGEHTEAEQDSSPKRPEVRLLVLDMYYLGSDWWRGSPGSGLSAFSGCSGSQDIICPSVSGTVDFLTCRVRGRVIQPQGQSARMLPGSSTSSEYRNWMKLRHQNSDCARISRCVDNTLSSMCRIGLPWKPSHPHSRIQGLHNTVVHA